MDMYILYGIFTYSYKTNQVNVGKYIYIYMVNIPYMDPMGYDNRWSVTF